MNTEAVNSSDWWEYLPGQRVMTREGLPGVVTAVEDGPTAGNETYLVNLDANMGGGEYSSSDLSPMPERATASVASVERTAADDYPELGDILAERPPPPLSTMAKLAGHYEDNPAALALESAAADLLRTANDWRWVPDYPGEPRDVPGGMQEVVSPPPESVQVESGWLMDLLTPPTEETSLDWCRFRRANDCWYPKSLNEQATRQAGYAVWNPFNRGRCLRATWEQQKACPIGEPGPRAHGFTDATVPWDQGGQRGGRPGPARLPQYSASGLGDLSFLDEQGPVRHAGGMARSAVDLPAGKRLRLRADEIQPGDFYVYKKPGGGHGATQVAAVPKSRERSIGGAAITRVLIATPDLAPLSVAPHSKHDVIRPAEPPTDLPIPERARYWVDLALESQQAHTGGAGYSADELGLPEVTRRELAENPLPPNVEWRLDEDGYPILANTTHEHLYGPRMSEEQARAAGWVGPLYHGTSEENAREIELRGFRQPRFDDDELRDWGTIEEVTGGRTHETHFAEQPEYAHQFAAGNHEHPAVVRAYVHPDHVRQGATWTGEPMLYVRDVRHAAVVPG